MYNESAKHRVAPEKPDPYRSGFAFYVIKGNTEGVVMTDIVKICKVENCNRKSRTLQFCEMHYQRYKKHGDPLFCLNPRREKIEIPLGFVQICRDHGLLKKEEVYRYREKNKVLYFKCKKCANRRTRLWEKNNPDAVKKGRHRNYVKHAKKYIAKSILRQKPTLLTLDEYNLMFEEQNNKCAICGQEEIKKRKNGTLSPLSVDHCHITGKIRSLLCFKCNTGLGMFQDSEEIIKKAYEYLIKWGIINKKEGETCV